MAILKHIASKNADYGEAQRYLIFQYDESVKKPVLDENGKLQLREEYYLDGINCDPFTFDEECKELNARFHKNKAFNEIKSHHYIISFDPEDKDKNGLTGERAQQLGLEYAKKNFPGHQALVCTHTDGHNESGNIHVHIVINSLRKFDVEQQDFMERPCDSRSGNKHHLTKDYLIYLKQSLMDICQRENLSQVDLLTPAEKKITEQEYWANRRGQKQLDKQNRQMIADGITPHNTQFQTQKQFLRNAINEATESVQSLKEFQNILLNKYGIHLIDSHERFLYFHPQREKPISEKSLGIRYEKEYLQQIIESHIPPALAVIFVKSRLHLVTDLQTCIKAQQSRAYARKVKLSNLKEMSKTVSYIQEHGYDTRDSLEGSFSSIKGQLADSKKALKSIEKQLQETNEQIHYTGQYLAHKAVHAEFLKSKNKGNFRKEHDAELTLYDEALKFLKTKNNGTRIPSMKSLKVEKEKLTSQKAILSEKYQYLKNYQKELRTVCANVDSILNYHESPPKEKQKEQDLS